LQQSNSFANRLVAADWDFGEKENRPSNQRPTLVPSFQSAKRKLRKVQKHVATDFDVDDDEEEDAKLKIRSRDEEMVAASLLHLSSTPSTVRTLQVRSQRNMAIDSDDDV
jgi:hypothetical protein